MNEAKPTKSLAAKSKKTLASEKTKRKLAAALKTQLNGKNFSRITISDLVDTCGMNRKTFYYHFRSTGELLAWMIEREAGPVLKKIDLADDYEEAISFVIDYIEDNRRMLHSINASVGWNEVHKFLRRNITPIIARSMEKFGNTADLEPDFLDFAVEFYTEAVAGILQTWLEKEIPRDKQTITRYVAQAIEEIKLIQRTLPQRQTQPA